MVIWASFAGASVVALAVMCVPGYALAWIAGIRGLWAWALSGPFGLTVIALASLAGPFVGARWNIFVCLGVMIAIGLILGLLRLFTSMRKVDCSEAPRNSWWPAVSLLIAAAVAGVVMVQIIGNPENISQTFDNVFHLNAVRFILDTGNASPLHVGTMTSPSGSLWFYPAVWHATSALVVQLTGCSIPMAANAVTFALSMFVWPAGVVLLTRVLFGRRWFMTLAAGVFAGAVPAFPILMINYGVLYPYHMGLCALPAAVALLVRLLGITEERGDSALRSVILVVGSLPGMALAHPGAFMAWLVLAGIAATIALATTLINRRGTIRWIASAGYLVFVVFAVLGARVLRPPLEARGWPTTETIGQAIGEVVTLSMSGGAVAVVSAIAALIGLTVCARRRRKPDVFAAVTYLAFAILYVAASALPWQTLRDLLTASWYDNAPRLAALLPIIVIPLAALGAQAVAERVHPIVANSRVFARARTAGRPLRIVGLAAVMAGFVIVTQGIAVRQAVFSAHGSYALTAQSPLLSADEMALLRKLPDLVPREAVIAGSPWTGTSLAFAISDRRVLFPHILMESDSDDAVISESADDAQPGSQICAALQRKGVEYILDFGSREVHGAEHPYPGFSDLKHSSSVVQVARVGAASLYRITACG